jgi:hypothetical protein
VLAATDLYRFVRNPQGRDLETRLARGHYEAAGGLELFVAANAGKLKDNTLF